MIITGIPVQRCKIPFKVFEGEAGIRMRITGDESAVIVIDKTLAADLPVHHHGDGE